MNAMSKQLERARAFYRALHWGGPAPRDFSRWRVPDPREGPIVELGALLAVEYETEKIGDGLSVYRHEFGRPDGSRCPILCVNGERRLIIAGDYYRVTNAGIEG